ncbi:restriction endonuclease subunit S [Enterococcus sp. LJL128]
MGKMYKLTDVCDFQGGTQPPKNEWILSEKDDYIRMLQIRDFTQNNVKNEYVKDSDKLKKCKSDDILVARYGASVGKILTGLTGAYNVAIMKTIPSNEVIKRYLLFYLKSSYFQHKIRNVGSRAAQAGFNKADLSTFDIFLPTIETQQKIADILDLSSALIEKRKDQIAEMERLEQSQFNELFGNPIRNEKLWNTRLIKDITLDMKYGTSEKSEIYKTNVTDVPIIRIPNVKRNSLDISNVKYLPKAVIKDNMLLRDDDLLFVRSNGNPNYIGRVACVGKIDGVFSYASYLIRLRVDKEVILPKFLTFMLSTDNFRTYISSYGSTTAGNYNINTQKLKNIKIIVPSKREQDKFINFIEEVESQKKVMEESLHEMENNFNALMQKAFRGELFPEE